MRCVRCAFAGLRVDDDVDTDDDDKRAGSTFGIMTNTLRVLFHERACVCFSLCAWRFGGCLRRCWRDNNDLMTMAFRRNGGPNGMIILCLVGRRQYVFDELLQQCGHSEIRTHLLRNDCENPIRVCANIFARSFPSRRTVFSYNFVTPAPPTRRTWQC